MALRWRATLTFGLTAILLLAELLTIFSNGASAQVNGNSYTGPIHGHTLSWNDSWQVLDEKTDRGEDWILLGDGLSLVGISGVDAYLGNATACARGLLVMLSRDANISNVTPMIGPDGQEVRGGDDSRAFVAYTYTMAVASGPTVDVGRPYASSKIQNSGATVDLAHRRECRTIVPGRSVLVIDHMAPVAAYDVEAPLVEALIAGVTIPSPGETGPAFMTGRLRIAVAGAVEDSAISAVKLSARPGKDWLFLLVDVTNTSSTVAPVTPSDFGLATAGRTKPAHLATGSTTSVAKRLQVEQGDVDAAVQIGPGETRRLVLVFQVPAGAAQPSLRIGSTALPLQAALGRRIDFQHLPASYGPPRLIEAAVDHVIDGDTLSVIPTGQTTPVSVSLIGVDAPVGTECYADKAQTKLRSLAGQNVILESDSTDRQSGRLARYVWTRKDDGSLSMVNRTLLAGGYAGFATSPNDRFGDWLRQGADAARIKPAGLWKACTGLHGTAQAQNDATESVPAAPTQVKSGSVETVKDGVYQGTTAEGWAMSLTVKDNGIVGYTYDFVCDGGNGRGSGNLTAPAPITARAFKIEQHVGPLNVMFSGTFRTDDTATGALEVTQPDGLCGGSINTTWEARLAG